MSDFIDDDLLKDWFEEAYSQIEEIELNVLNLEKNIDDMDAVDAIFRAAHTLKGGAATVQMDEIAKFSHSLEDSMDEIRNGSVKVSPKIVDVILTALDILKNMVNARSNGSVYSDDYQDTIDKLREIVEKKGTSANGGDPAPVTKEEKADVIESGSQSDESGNDEIISEYDQLEIQEANPDKLPVYKVIVTFDENNPMRTVGGIQVFTALRDVGLILKTFPDFDDLYSEDFHKVVTYIVASNEPVDKIKEYAYVPDATVEREVLPYNAKSEQENAHKQRVGGSTETSESKTEPVVESAISEREREIDQMAKSITDEVVSKKEPVNDNDFNEVEKEIQKTQEVKKPEEKKSNTEFQKPAAASVLRVDSSRIDDLLNLASEIVINKATFNQVNSQFSTNLEDLSYSLSNQKDAIKKMMEKLPQYFDELGNGGSFNQIKKKIQSEFSGALGQLDSFSSQFKGTLDRLKSTTQNLDRISFSLREGVMRVRMIQIKQIYNRFPRLVRDLCRNLSKEVELVLEGEDTEIDKAMLDDLIDPLIHIVRNAIDHGFESPSEREENGKTNPGKLVIKALNEGNLISIYIMDDGKGIDPERIKKKAIEKGVISADKILREQEVFNLIFEPGFSTADKVTSVSGRGVGLDVVKRNIEKLSGTIRVTSNLGVGTTFAIKLPLTLAIIQGLMIKVQDEVYALPISSVLESMRITKEEIKSIDNYEVINVRDDVLSLLRLNRLFNLEEKENEEEKYYFVVIVGVGDKKIGLLVDSLIGEEDIVIKPLRDKYTNTPGVAGATFLGDGTVSLILDVSQLIELGLKHEMNAKNNMTRRL